MPKLLKQQRVEMRAAGATYQAIADAQGVSRISVQKWFKELKNKEIRDKEKDRKKAGVIPERDLMPGCGGCKFAAGARCDIFLEPKYAWADGKCPQYLIQYKKRYSDKLIAECQGCFNADKGRNRCEVLKEPGWHWRGDRKCTFRNEDPKWQEKFEAASKAYMYCNAGGRLVDDDV